MHLLSNALPGGGQRLDPGAAGGGAASVQHRGIHRGRRAAGKGSRPAQTQNARPVRIRVALADDHPARREQLLDRDPLGLGRFAVLHFASPTSPVDYLELPIQTLKVGAITDTVTITEKVSTVEPSSGNGPTGGVTVNDTVGADRAGRNLKPEYIIQNGDVLFS